MRALQNFLARLRLRDQGRSNYHPQPQNLENSPDLAHHQPPPSFPSSSPPPSYQSSPPAYAEEETFENLLNNYLVALAPLVSSNQIEVADAMADRHQVNSAAMAAPDVRGVRGARAEPNSQVLRPDQGGTSANISAPAPVAVRALPGYRQRQELSSIIAVPVTQWPLFLLPIFVWLLNAAILGVTCFCLRFSRDYKSWAEERLEVVFSFPKKTNLSLMAMSGFGLLVGFLQLLVNPCSPWRKFNFRGYIAGLYFIYLIWLLAEMALYGALKTKAIHDFDGEESFNTSLALTVIQVVLLVAYALWPGNPLRYQRVANGPGRNADEIPLNIFGYDVEPGYNPEAAQLRGEAIRRAAHARRRLQANVADEHQHAPSRTVSSRPVSNQAGLLAPTHNLDNNLPGLPQVVYPTSNQAGHRISSRDSDADLSRAFQAYYPTAHQASSRAPNRNLNAELRGSSRVVSYRSYDRAVHRARNRGVRAGPPRASRVVSSRTTFRPSGPRGRSRSVDATRPDTSRAHLRRTVSHLDTRRNAPRFYARDSIPLDATVTSPRGATCKHGTMAKMYRM